MIKKQLYRVQRENGGVTVTPFRPEKAGYEVAGYRLIPAEGKAITNDGVNLFDVRDVENAEGYYEVDIPEESEEIENE